MHFYPCPCLPECFGYGLLPQCLIDEEDNVGRFFHAANKRDSNRMAALI